MIRLENVTKSFIGSEVATTAINQLNVAIQPGEFIAVTGASGSGKSTLLNCIGLLERFDNGSYWFQGHDLAKLSNQKIQQFRTENFGYIFQNFNLIDELTVYQNVELALIYRGISASARKLAVLEVLERLQLTHRLKHTPSQLSGGQQQRVAVARALVGKPKLILADEPTGNLDSATGQEVMQLLTELHAQGTTIFMVTHSKEHALQAQRVLEMKDGQLIRDSQRLDKAG